VVCGCLRKDKLAKANIEVGIYVDKPATAMQQRENYLLAVYV
jgi:hypothetical protein